MAQATIIERWRRRPQVRCEGVETSGVGFKDSPTPRWHLWGAHVDEDIARMMDGLICVRCFTPYPERPGYMEPHELWRLMGPWGRPEHEVIRLLEAGHCGICGNEVSPEMAQAFFAGYVTRSTEEREGATRRAGQHEDFERIIAKDGMLARSGTLWLPPNRVRKT